VNPYYGFFSAALDGATEERPIQNRVFGQFCSIDVYSFIEYGSSKN